MNPHRVTLAFDLFVGPLDQLASEAVQGTGRGDLLVASLNDVGVEIDVCTVDLDSNVPMERTRKCLMEDSD